MSSQFHEDYLKPLLLDKPKDNMKAFVITKVNDDETETVLHYPCSSWEISLMIISATKVFPLRGTVEFKSYKGDGTQVLERHYFSEFYVQNND